MKHSNSYSHTIGLIVMTFCLPALAPFAAYAQWEPDRRISTSDSTARLNENMGPCLAVTGDTVQIVWSENTVNGSAIFHRHSFDAGLSWSTAERLTASDGTADLPSVAVSGPYVHVVYRDSSSGQRATNYIRSTDAGLSWEPNVPLGNYYWWPSVAASAGMVFVALNDNHPGNSEVYCRRSADNGMTWDSVRQISNATGRSEDPAIAAGDGWVHLVWNDNRTGIMQTWYRHSSDNGITWGMETQLTSSPIFAYCPMITVTGPAVDFAWADRAPGNYEIFYKNSPDHGLTWGDPVQISRSGTTSIYPVVVRGGRNVHITWPTTNADFSYRHSSDGGISWDQIYSVAGSALKPGLGFVRVGGTVVHAIWTDLRNGHPTVYYRRNPTGNPGPQSMVHCGDAIPPGDALMVAMAPDPFRDETVITVRTRRTGPVSVEVADMLGRTVALLPAEVPADGRTALVWHPTGLPPGVYAIRVKDGGITLVRSVVHLR